MIGKKLIKAGVKSSNKAAKMVTQSQSTIKVGKMIIKSENKRTKEQSEDSVKRLPSKRKRSKPPVYVDNSSSSESESAYEEEEEQESGQLNKAGGKSMQGPQPVRDEKTRVLSFSDQKTFRPNRTPSEVLHAGAFGGGYFRDIKSTVTGKSYTNTWQELPEEWLKGLNINKQVASTVYRDGNNKHGVNCGVKENKQDAFGLAAWEASGWMNAQDPYGWFQWYCRFYQGRRSDDDVRQISRWCKCAGVTGRWRNNLIGKVLMQQTTFDNGNVSPVVRQTLLHWGYELTEADFILGSARVKKNGASYVPKDQLAAVMDKKK